MSKAVAKKEANLPSAEMFDDYDFQGQVDKYDYKIPRLSLVQFTGDLGPKFGLQPGTWCRSSDGVKYGNCAYQKDGEEAVQIVPIMFWKELHMIDGKVTKLRCPWKPDMEEWVQTNYNNDVTYKHEGQEYDGNPRKAFCFFVWIVGSDTPNALTLRGTGGRAGHSLAHHFATCFAKLEEYRKTGKGEQRIPYDRIFELAGEMKENEHGKFFAAGVKEFDSTTIEIMNQCHKWFKQLKDINPMEVAPEDGEGGSPDEARDVTEASVEDVNTGEF